MSPLYKIRAELPRDIQAIFELNKEAFETEAEAKLVDALRESGNLLLSLVAAEGQDIMGHIAYSPMTLEGQGDLKLAGLAPMAVTLKKQKHGIGSALIQEGERQLKSMGIDAVFVLGHADYYPRFGFQPSLSTFGIRSKYEVPDEVFMAKVLSARGLRNLSGVVRYAPEFDAL